MAYAIYTGNQRSLVFPIMCNAFVTIPYRDNIVDTGSNSDTSDDIPYGIWAHDGDFTFEAIVTPYDVNGYGTSSTNGYNRIPSDGNLTGSSTNTQSDSLKIMPAVNEGGTGSNFESESYLSSTARLTHEMRLFHSTHFQVSLVNDTLHNENQPAQYKIKVGVKLGTASIEEFTSPIVISPNQLSKYRYDSSSDVYGFNSDGYREYESVTTISSVSGANLTVGSVTNLFDGSKQEVFIRSGNDFISLGTIDSISGSVVTLDETPTTTISTTSPDNALFVRAIQEPLYINDLHHIGCTWSNEDKVVRIYYNGTLVKSGTHTQSNDFSFAREDFVIGQKDTTTRSGAGSAVTNKQFMGELHEMAISKGLAKSFVGMYNLLPTFEDVMLYLRFEEVDL